MTTGETPHEPAVRPWELELLISGAVTFALLQLPGRLGAWHGALVPQLDRSGAIVVTLLYYYGRMILYVLIGGFSTHLAARAYWVGMIGLESVFPDGVRWEGTRYGPVMREVYARRIAGLQPLIDRADRFCSIIFPAAFSLVLMFLYSVVTVGIVAGVSVLISRYVFDGRYLMGVYLAAVALFVLFSSTVTLLDRWKGDALEEGHRGRRALQRGGVALYYVSGMAVFGAVWMILFSNLPRRAVATGLYLSIMVLFAIAFLGDVLFRSGGVRLDGYRYLPQEGARVVGAVHYDALRTAADLRDPAPSIPADVVTGPYLKLFVPYVPARLNQVVAERCPALPRPDRTFSLIPTPGATMPASQQDSILSCLAGLRPVKLNGRGITPDYRFYQHPRSGLRGIVAYIPAAMLQPGENLLEIAGAPRPAGSDRPARDADLIPFWR